MGPLGLCVGLHNEHSACLILGRVPNSPPETTLGGRAGTPGSVWCSAGPLEVLVVPAHCQDTYQGWILLLGPVPCHPRGHPQRKSLPLGPDQWVVQQCHMHTQSRAIAGMCPQLLSCHGLGPSSTPSSCVSTLNTSPAAQRPGSPLGSWPPSVAVAKGLSCLVPLAAALTLSRTQKGVEIPGRNCPSPACPRVFEGPATASFPPSPGN